MIWEMKIYKIINDLECIVFYFLKMYQSSFLFARSETKLFYTELPNMLIKNIATSQQVSYDLLFVALITSNKRNHFMYLYDFSYSSLGNINVYAFLTENKVKNVIQIQ